MSARENAQSPRHVLGRMVRYYRGKAGMSRPEVAAAICKSVSLVESIERGERVATEDVTADLDRVLGASGDLIHLREEMAEGISYQPFAAWFEDWADEIVPRARRLRTFEPNVVPGLLQTEDYARAVFGTRFGITDEEIVRRVTLRMKRQEIFACDDPPAFWAILDEGVLRRSAGGRYAMADQVRRLVECARHPRMVIRIVPASVGIYDGLFGGGFTIADFADGPSIGQQEGIVRGGQLVRDVADVESLEIVWDTLRDEALPRAASLELMEEVAKSWTSPA